MIIMMCTFISLTISETATQIDYLAGWQGMKESLSHIQASRKVDVIVCDTLLLLYCLRLIYLYPRPIQIFLHRHVCTTNLNQFFSHCAGGQYAVNEYGSQ